MLSVPFQKMSSDAIVPYYALPGSAGLDLSSCVSMVIEPHTWGLVPTGIKMAIPEGYEGQVRPRSGLAAKNGLTVLNSPGTIDSDYRGEIIVILMNHSASPFSIEKGMRIAQLVIAPVSAVALQEVAAFTETARGTGKFGSTGV